VVYTPQFVTSKRLLYYPNNHAGVNALMGSLKEAYSEVTLNGVLDADELSLEYEANLFDTWTAIEFELTDEQISSGLLITSDTGLTNVNYKIRICPSQMVCAILRACIYTHSMPKSK
jgi:hypothetical protein